MILKQMEPSVQADIHAVRQFTWRLPGAALLGILARLRKSLQELTPIAR